MSTDDILECLDDIQWYLDRGEFVGIASIVNKLRRDIREAKTMNLGDRVQTTQWWSDRYNQGHVKHGTLTKIKNPTPLSSRTHYVVLDELFLDEFGALSFLPTDIELETGSNGYRGSSSNHSVVV